MFESDFMVLFEQYESTITNTKISLSDKIRLQDFNSIFGYNWIIKHFKVGKSTAIIDSISIQYWKLQQKLDLKVVYSVYGKGQVLMCAE